MDVVIFMTMVWVIIHLGRDLFNPSRFRSK